MPLDNVRLLSQEQIVSTLTFYFSVFLPMAYQNCHVPLLNLLTFTHLVPGLASLREPWTQSEKDVLKKCQQFPLRPVQLQGLKGKEEK